jgi:hypothetical protein
MTFGRTLTALAKKPIYAANPFLFFPYIVSAQRSHVLHSTITTNLVFSTYHFLLADLPHQQACKQGYQDPQHRTFLFLINFSGGNRFLTSFFIFSIS